MKKVKLVVEKSKFKILYLSKLILFVLFSNVSQKKTKKKRNLYRSRSSSQVNMMGNNSTHRLSPVSCCGSSQGRSSPDGDINEDGVDEPLPMPLSPG